MGLKLEPQKNSKIRLTIQNRNKILTKDFVKALTFAVLIHMIAFSLFHIDLGLFSTTLEYPAVIVQSHAFPSHIEYADTEIETPKVPHFLNIKQQDLPTHPSVFSEIGMNYNEQTFFDLSDLDLDSLNQPGISKFYLALGNSFKKPPILIHSKVICRAKLEFKADKTGKIFWLDWIEHTGDTALDYQIVETLKAISLIPNSALVAFPGIVEIEFEPHLRASI